MTRKSRKSAEKARRSLNLQTLEPRDVPTTGIALDTVNGQYRYTITNDGGESVRITLGRAGANYTLSLTDLAGGNPKDFVNTNGNANIGVAGTTATLVVAPTSPPTGAPPAVLVFDLGNQADELVIGQGTLGAFSASALDVTVVGGGGADIDVLTVNDSASSGGKAYGLTGTTVARTDGLGIQIELADIEQVTLRAGTGNDTIGAATFTPELDVRAGDGNDQVSIGAAANPVTVSTGDGSDTITVGGGDLGTLTGTLTLDAGNNSDRLVVDDSANTAEAAYAVDGTKVERTVAGVTTTVTYTGADFQQLELKAGAPAAAAKNTIAVTSPALPTTVTGGAGKDDITVASTSTSDPVTVNAGAGDDTIAVGPFDALAATVAANGQGDTDILTVDDSTETTGSAYTIGTTQVTRGGKTVTFGTIEDLALLTGTADDTVTIEELDTLVAALTLDAGGGAADKLVVDDSANTAASTYAIDATKVERTAPGATRTVTYQNANFEQLELKAGAPAGAAKNTITVTAPAVPTTVTGGAGKDDITVASTATDTPVTVNAGAGDDSVTVTGTAANGGVTANGGTGSDTFTVGPFDGLAAGVTVDGQGGSGATDVLTVDDRTETTGSVYTVDSDDVTRGVTVAFAAVEELTLLTGSGNDTVNVTDTDIPVTMQTGLGDDTVNLPVLGGPVDLDGGLGGVDQVNFDNTGDNTARTYTISGAGTDTLIERGNTRQLTFREFSSAEVTGGSRGDTFKATDVGSLLTAVVLNGGAGDGQDQFEVTGSAVVSYTVKGGDPASDPGDKLTIKSPIMPADIETPPPGSGAGTLDFPAPSTLLDVVYTGIEDIEFETQSVTPKPGADLAETMTITPTGPRKGSYEIRDAVGNLIQKRSYSTTEQITWDGGALTDTIVINDVAVPATTKIDYTVSYSVATSTWLIIRAVEGTPPVGMSITGKNVENIVINGGLGDDTISVGAVPVGSSIIISSGAGADEVNLSGTTTGNVTITGGDGNDVITQAGALGTSSIDGGLGDDDIKLDSMSGATTVSGGAGNDIIRLGGGILGNIAFGLLTLTPGADTDTLVLDDSQAPAGTDKTYTVTATTVTDGTFTFPYAVTDLEQVQMNAGLANDTINVQATGIRPVTVNGGGGADTINVGFVDPITLLSTLDTIQSPVEVVGGDQTGVTDRLNISDSGSAVGHTYQITPAQSLPPALPPRVTRDGTVTVSYTAIEDLSFVTTAFADTINVTGTEAGVSTTVNAGDGADAVNVGTLDSLAGGLSLEAAETVLVDDSAAPAGHTYTIDTAVGTPHVTRDLAPRISFLTAPATLTVKTSGLQDAIFIPRTADAAGTDLTVDAGADNDLVILGDDADTTNGGDLDNLDSTPTLIAGSGRDQLILADDAATGGRTFTFDQPAVGPYRVTAGPLAAGTDLSIEYQTAGFEEVEVRGGIGADTVNVYATAVNVAVAGGGGVDQVTVGDGDLSKVFGIVTVDAGPPAGPADVETLHLNDGGSATGNDYTFTQDGSDYVVRRNAATLEVLYRGFDQVTLAAGIGGDTVAVQQTDAGVGVTVLGGDGTDAISTGALDNLGGPVSLTGGAGIDTVTVNDDANSTGHGYSVLADRLTRTAGNVTVGFSESERVELVTGTGNDTVGVGAIGDGVTLDVRTGDGDDAVILGGNRLDLILGTFTFDAGAGTDDALTIDDSGDPDDNRYRLTASATSATVTRESILPAVTVEYLNSNVEGLVVLAGQGGDSITVNGTTADTPITVNGGTGNDAFTVGTDLGAVRAPLTLLGGDGDNSLNVDDSLASGANAYVVTSDTVTRSTAGVPGERVIRHTAFTALALQAGSGANTVAVPEINKPVTVTGGSGNDDIVFGGLTPGGTGSLDGLTSSIAVSGGLGTNTLTLNDSDDSTDNTYEIGANQIDRYPTSNPTPVQPSIPFDTSFSSVVLRAGQGADTIVSKTNQTAVLVAADAGEGDDTFDFQGGTITGTITGGTGNDLIVGDAVDRTFTITNPDAGRVAGLIGTAVPLTIDTFASVESLTGGSGSDAFRFEGGALTGTVTGGAGSDHIFGDNLDRTYRLTANGEGRIDVLLTKFTGIESFHAGTGNDTFSVASELRSDTGAYTLFEGGPGLDKADFGEWASDTPIQLTLLGSGATGFSLTDVSIDLNSVPTDPARPLRGIDQVAGGSADHDSLGDATKTLTANWRIAGSGQTYYTQADFATAANDPALRLDFDGLERLKGGFGVDTFRFELAAAPGENFLVEASPAPGDRIDDRLDVIGTDDADTFKLLERREAWPATETRYNGISAETGQSTARILYTGVRILDLEGGAGTDTFIVHPEKTPRKKDRRSLYGDEVKTVLLQGQAGNDYFQIVPFRYKNPGGLSAAKLPRVQLHIFGGSGHIAPPAGVTDPFNIRDNRPPGSSYIGEGSEDQDVMSLYRLPVKPKADFPVNGRKGSPSHKLLLYPTSNHYGTVFYYNMWTVKAKTGLVPHTLGELGVTP